MGSPDLTQSFQRTACPANLPIHDSGIDPQGYQVPMTEIVATALPHAKVLMYADTNHYNPLLTKPTSSKPFLETLRDGNVSDIKIEVPVKHQSLIERYNDGALTRSELEEKFQADTDLKGNEVGDVTRAVGRTAEFTRDNNMNFNFSDHGNGFGSGEDHRDRFKDKKLADDINAAPGKVFLQYGHLHFSSDDERKQIEGGLVKLDVYQNRQSYEGTKSSLARDNENGFKFNEAKPDLIYFQDSKTVHTTCNTPEALKKDIEKAAADYAPKPAAEATPAPAAAATTKNYETLER